MSVAVACINHGAVVILHTTQDLGYAPDQLSLAQNISRHECLPKD
jgi:hypothetical protein